MTFTCKDCETEFGTAKAFVDHVPECIPYNSGASLQLQNAAMFLREFMLEGIKIVKIGQINDLTLGFPKRTKRTPLEKLLANTWKWLKANKLQGDLK
jgi:hypothetical protein